ncbi:MAG: MarR family winged helix-turn-helix transcriptional regulator, partial [Thermomicrobiales bacterium]
LQAQRAFNAQAIRKLRERGHETLGLAHTALLPYLDLDGTRITTLAERAGMTKQGMGQLVLDLERQGYVVRATDPADRRATLVYFTEAGWQFLRDAHAVKRELEAEYAAVLGADGLEALRTALTALIEHEHERD